ncbi:MAG: hypothetical protein RL260_3883, partial [Pseudomonadota bacterium]
MTHNNSTPTFRTCNFARWIGTTLLLSLLSACNVGGEEEPVQATTSAAL